MKTWVDSKVFQRFLEIVPGFLIWSLLLMPIVLAPIAPVGVAIFILSYSLFWFCKVINISRHLMTGYLRMRWTMKIDWLELCEKTRNIKALQKLLEKKYLKKRGRFAWEALLPVQNLEGIQSNVKDWHDIIHVVLIAVSTETIEIVKPTVERVLTLAYPNKKIIIVLAGEERFKESFVPIAKELESAYGSEFLDFKYYLHTLKKGEVKGKGSGIASAGKAFWAEFKKLNIDPRDVLLTNLDADHIMHEQYLARLTYLYVTDPSRDQKSYQPVPLLFNNIWDVPAPNRVSAVGSSFWQIIESMRSYRQRTFAAHTQSLAILLKTDFWAVNTIVEDGHQYWRTYFALNGEHAMVPLFLPVYQDAVMGRTRLEGLKNQYLQIRRWAWGVSDFPFVVKNCIKHKEIPTFERILQTCRQFAGSFTWATSSFLIAGAWIPLYFNKHFQESVIAHNVTTYSSLILQLALLGIAANVWVYFLLLPKRPKHHGVRRHVGMFLQWILAPFIAIPLSSLPALDSATRLMIGKYPFEFWITPKIRAKTGIATAPTTETPK